MNKLSTEDRARILHLLCEGQSIRAITRLTGVSKNTVTKLLVAAGKACWAYHDANVRNVKAKRVQVDEIWSFTYAKQKNVATAKAAPANAGDTWTWTAIEADTKLIVSYFVGGRDGECAMCLSTIFAPVSPIAFSLRATATRLILRRLKAHSARISTMRSL